MSERETVTALKPWFERHHDDEWIDEIRVSMVPRWKTSGLSGDEWRVSAVVEAYRKGRKVGEYTAGDMQSALALLPGRFLYRAPAVLEHGWRATEAGETWRAWEDECCFQPGCPEQATVEVRKVAEYCRRGHKTEPHRDTRRRFCERHKRRGDGGLDDADMNYEVVALRLPDGQWKHVGSQPWVGAPREA